MTIKILGEFDKNKLYCTGSLTKFLTTYVILSLLSESFDLDKILDDESFLDQLCTNKESKEFLKLFQTIIGSRFTIRDLCTYYTGLPYTFDAYEEELIKVNRGEPFKHHSILDEKEFLYLCNNKITSVYTNRCKFHYSELSILFLGYLLEKIYQNSFENLYQKYIRDAFNLKNSYFSRKIVENTHIQDLSNRYDYPSIAIQNHGYFCYSNGFYTTLNDMKTLLENILETKIFKIMTDIRYARAASNRIMNGLAVEIRLAGDDILYGYEGLSFSGCNLWAYSTAKKQGYIIQCESEEAVYDIVYEQNLRYKQFDRVLDSSQFFYNKFLKSYIPDSNKKPIPIEYQGAYHRVKINEYDLKDIFHLTSNEMIIRNPDEVKYEIIYAQNDFRIKGKDNIHGAKIGLYQSDHHFYFCFDGTLYKKIGDY